MTKWFQFSAMSLTGVTFIIQYNVFCCEFSTVNVAGKQEELHFDKINSENREHVRSHSFIMSPTCRNYCLLSCHFQRTVCILKYLHTGITKIKFYVLHLKLKIISWRNLLVLEPKRTQNSVISTQVIICALLPGVQENTFQFNVIKQKKSDSKYLHVFIDIIYDYDLCSFRHQIPVSLKL